MHCVFPNNVSTNKCCLGQEALAVAQEQLATIDELQALLGFHTRGLAIRWILEQLEHQGPLSSWTLEMLTREVNSTRSNQ